MSKTSSTTGESLNYTINKIDYVQQGWQCPICKRVLAPFVSMCPCSGLSCKTTMTVDDLYKSITIDAKELEEYYEKWKNCKIKEEK